MGLGRLIERASKDVAPYVGEAPSGIIMPYGMGPVGPYVDPRSGKTYPGLTPDDVVSPDQWSMGSAGLEGPITGLSAAWRCLHILTDGIAMLELYAYIDDATYERVPTPRSLADPWPVMTDVEWRAMVVASLVMYGNCYMLPYDEDPRTGFPRQLPIVHPNQVKVELVNGHPVYFINDNRMSALDVLHIRGYTTPGAVVGIGVVEAHRRGIRLANIIDRYQYNNIEQSAVPPAIIRVNRPEISEEQAFDIQGRWVSRHGYGSRAPAVLPTSMEVTPLAWSPEDAQFLESKQFMAVEICWWFGLDPRLLGLAAGGQSLVYSNIETTYVDLQRMSYMPWTSRIEAALGRILPRKQLARFDFAPILRTTLQDRYAAYAIGVEGGWLTIEEVRALENLGPLGQGLTDERSGRIQAFTEVNESLPAAESVEVVI